MSKQISDFFKMALLRVMSWVHRVLLMHVLLTLVSLPIIVAWGLPTSMLSFVGNLIFGPFLTFFLFVSSIMFFAQMCGVQAWPCAWILEWVTFLWSWIMECIDSNAWMYVFPEPPWWMLGLVFGATVAVMHYRRAQQPSWRLRLLVCVLIGAFMTLKTLGVFKPGLLRIPCNGGVVAVVNTGTQTIVIDTGKLGARCSASSWCRYTLLSEIAKFTGRRRIDHFITLRPTTFTFEALAVLHAHVDIVYTYVPLWRGTMSPQSLGAFGRLRSELERRGRVMLRIGSASMSCLKSGNKGMFLEPISGKVQYAGVEYASMAVTCRFDKQELTFYPSSYAKRLKTGFEGVYGYQEGTACRGA